MIQQQNTNNLEKLISTLHIQDLGDGDVTTGINQAVAMLCTLSNIAAPNSALVSKTGKEFPIKTNIVISGITSAHYIHDRVHSTLGTCQNNLTQHLYRHLSEKSKEADTSHDSAQVQTASGRFREQLFSAGDIPFTTRESLWSKMLTTRPSPTLESMCHNPRMIISADSPATLKKNLRGLLEHNALVLGKLSANGGDLYHALMSGSYPAEGSGDLIKASLLMTDTELNLASLLKERSYIDQLIWLVDGTAGPEVSMCADHQPIGQYSPLGYYTIAVGECLSRRLNSFELKHSDHAFDLTATQKKWMTFLKDTESELPGVTASCRNLPAALWFGLLELNRTLKQTTSTNHLITPLNITHAEIEALSYYVVTRMKNARSAMLYTEEKEQMQLLQAGVLRRLAEKPHTLRKLIRRHNKLPTATCKQVLNKLKDQGKVYLTDQDEWSLTPEYSQTTKLTLEI